MNLIYLHGFASSPRSRKAVFFRDRLVSRGMPVEVADHAPEFRKTRISSSLAVVERLLLPDTVILGSSLGGYLAALTAERHPDKVRALVLFAPAFELSARWEARLGPDEIESWHRSGTKLYLNHATGKEEPLDFEFLEDARRYPGQPRVSCPALIFAGRHDTTVTLDSIEPFAGSSPGRRLVVLDSDHELTDVLDTMWDQTWSFLQEI